MILYIRTKTVCGRELLYAECENTRLILEWLHQKTFTDRDIRTLRKLLFTIIIKE